MRENVASRPLQDLDARGLRLIARSFAAGAVFDLALSILIFWSPPGLLRALALPPPAEPLHFRFAALLLFVLPMFYVLPARDPVRYSGVAAAGTGARLAGALFLGGHVVFRAAPSAYALFAAADLAFAVVHAAGLRLAGLDPLGRRRHAGGTGR